MFTFLKQHNFNRPKDDLYSIPNVFYALITRFLIGQTF